MRFLAQNEANSTTNPVLSAFIQSAGILQDPFSLEFQIFNRTGGAPVQVFPTPAPNREPVDLVNHKIGEGAFIANYTVDGAEPKGLHSIKWFLVVNNGDPEQVFEQEFDVIEQGTVKPFGQRCYALISEIRAEDLPETQADDARVLQSIAVASQMIENFTNRVFGVTQKLIAVDGRDSPDLLLDEPIVGLSSLEILSNLFGSELVSTATDLEDISIYNRHLTQNLSDPDDRENPMISFFRLTDYLGNTNQDKRPLFPNFIFPFGQQNIRIAGAFGYTEPDGSPMGDVPRLIRRAATLLVGKRLIGKAFTAGDDPVPGGPIKRLKTRDQEVEFAVNTNNLGGAAPGPFTGDPEIDNILLMFARGPKLGAA